VKRPRSEFIFGQPETVVEAGDLLIVSGPTKLVEKFTALSD
jgi:trk system potassium uptake protein TrkA